MQQSQDIVAVCRLLSVPGMSDDKVLFENFSSPSIKGTRLCLQYLLKSNV